MEGSNSWRVFRLPPSHQQASDPLERKNNEWLTVQSIITFLEAQTSACRTLSSRTWSLRMVLALRSLGVFDLLPHNVIVGQEVSRRRLGFWPTKPVRRHLTLAQESRSQQ